MKDGADIVNIEDLTALTVQFALPERYIDRLRAGQSVDVAVDALPGRSFKGRVQAVDSQVDANGRALQVLAQVDNPGALLKPGMFARPRVVFSVREGAIVVPEEALVPLGAKQYRVQGRRRARRAEGVAAAGGEDRPAPAGQGRDPRGPAGRRRAWPPPGRRGCCAATACRCA